MKTIELTRGKVTIVDDDVYEWASKFKWQANKSLHTFYAVRTSYKFGKKRDIKLHREIMQTPPELEVNHEDGDGLNNLRENLSNVTHLVNMNAFRTPKTRGLNFWGVTRHKKAKKWQVQIVISRKVVYLGLFVSEEAAAQAHDAAAIKNFGECAQLNFPIKL